MKFIFNKNIINLVNDIDFVSIFLNKFNYSFLKGDVQPYQWEIYYRLHPVVKEKALRLLSNRYKKLSRLSKRVQFMLNNDKDTIFVTLTLKKEYSFEYVKKYVKEFVKNYDFYIANPDWGKTNGRLHWHLLVNADNVDHNLWPLGAINFERVRKSTTDCKKVAKYVLKLSQHAVKDSVQGQKIMYSRNFAKFGVN